MSTCELCFEFFSRCFVAHYLELWCHLHRYESDHRVTFASEMTYVITVAPSHTLDTQTIFQRDKFHACTILRTIARHPSRFRWLHFEYKNKPVILVSFVGFLTVEVGDFRSIQETLKGYQQQAHQWMGSGAEYCGRVSVECDDFIEAAPKPERAGFLAHPGQESSGRVPEGLVTISVFI